MVMKEMPLEEKYNKLLDYYVLNEIGSYALVKELGAVDKGFDLSVKASVKMLPNRVGIAFELLKILTPGTAFNQLIEKYVYSLQMTIPLQNIELNKVSDRESTYRINNCPIIKRMRSLAKKTGLDIDPKFYCEIESKIIQGVANEFGVTLVTKLTKNGCINTAKLSIGTIVFSS